MKEFRRIVVLKGGWCSEREISLISGATAADALRDEGYSVEEIDVGRDLATVLPASFDRLGPDAVFNALHGPFGEDGRVQGLLEILNIPYTHSGVLSSALCMNKPRAKMVLAQAGLKVPEGRTLPLNSLTGRHPMAAPYVLKPIGDGSSFGVNIVMSEQEVAPKTEDLDADLFGTEALVETFIPGRELTVSVLGAVALGVTEIVPKNTFYDFESKYAEGGSTHVLPADIPEEVADAVKAQSLKAVQALGCRGLSRVDFRWDDRSGVNGLFILEVNTQPGMTPTSLSPEQAAAAGIDFGALVRWMIEDASCLR
ncbi:D-alanylalanine synthetase [Parvularcula bermudensis HTCC2503]|uniref:D-alanine--D-alanine ligase n=1 Tax=Parvularcula bermudensis (strain ATCC BAA-594 / HTCC2503 / KCTC 12087) TaxID=314260 RepID=E0TDT4_PARBH|nr:D-alanine--D-alanine ligase [Parvularcula bermudensis]ADM10000.1 D-alanylalanine synthetase [Parvularcula bermudensis HTCC2503]